MIQQVVDCWSKSHRTNCRDDLTGTSFQSFVDYLELHELLRAGLRVLEVGPGLGYCTKGLADMGCFVSVIDICEGALHRVRQWIEQGYLHNNLDALPKEHFDLAVSLLVTQHMSEDDILLQFPSILWALKPSGRFRVQFAGSDIEEENNRSETIVGERADNKVSMLGGRMVRTPEYAVDLIERCGGTVVEEGGRRQWPKYNSYWYWLDVIRGKALA